MFTPTCENYTNLIKKVARTAPGLVVTENNPLNLALETKRQIRSEIAELLEFLDSDQVELRDRIAKEKGYSFVGKFNEYGLAKAVFKLEGLESPEILINKKGEVIFSEDNDKKCKISDFSEGLALVSIEASGGQKGHYYIDVDGKRIDDKNYREANSYKFGQALVRYHGQEEKQKYHLIDYKGNEIRTIDIGRIMDDRWSGSGYLGLHTPDFGAWHVAPSGERIPKDPSKFFEDGMGDLNTGIAKVCDRFGKNRSNNSWYFINQKGENLNEGVLGQGFESATDFYQDRAFVQTADGKTLLIDIHGKIIREFQTESLGKINPIHSKIKDGLLLFEKTISNGPPQICSYHLVDITGKILLEREGERFVIHDFSEGLGFVSGPSEQFNFTTSDGRALQTTVREQELITLDGSIIESDERITTAQPFKDGVALVGKILSDGHNNMFYIDKKGRRVFS